MVYFDSIVRALARARDFGKFPVAIGMLGLFAFSFAAHAANIDIGSGLRVNSSVASLKDIRDRNVVRQQFDYSCGAAALATIMRYGFGEDVGEQDILDQLFEILPDEEEGLRTNDGFSLLDLQRVAQARQYRAEGFRIAPQFLSQLNGPVIVFIQPRGYNHFAVLRGVQDDRVYLADPSRGNVRMPAYAFLDMWLQEDGMGIIFAVEPNAGLPEGASPLLLSIEGITNPEMMTAREMLAVGNPFVRFPELSR
jgi:uncharacterized protein